MPAWLSHSEEQTYKLGKQLGKHVRPGDIILLFGDLGSGKTVFSRGIAHGVGFRKLPVHIYYNNTYVEGCQFMF